jgi:hypothetical protein
LGRLLRLKVGFIVAQNLKQHGKMFLSFLSLAKNLRQFAENLKDCFQGGGNFGQNWKFYSGCPTNSLKSSTSPGALSHEREYVH